MASEHRLQENFTMAFSEIRPLVPLFQIEFVVAKSGFLSYYNHQPIRFEEDKRFGP